MNRYLVAGLGAAIAVILLMSCVFVVDQRKFAIVFSLGEIKREIREPGLYFKLPPPLQNVEYFDSRILTIDTPDADRVQTSQKINLLVDSLVKWRISDPKQFYVSFRGSERSAMERMNILVREAMQNSISRRTVNDVVSRERDVIMKEIKLSVADRVKGLGVEIVDVRLKRVEFVAETLDSVFGRMASDRKSVAAERRSIGASESEKIRADAERQQTVLLAVAYRDAQKIRGEGDAKASALYAQAFGQNPEFASFYRSLESYRATFASRNNLMVLDPTSDYFRYLKQPGTAAPARR
ncbi:protease modulator HflC [soil metagenome]